jgi:hypothetical protein
MNFSLLRDCQYRAWYWNLQIRCFDLISRTRMITSEMPRECKDTTSFNIGFNPRAEDVERRFENLRSSLSAILGRMYSSVNILKDISNSDSTFLWHIAAKSRQNRLGFQIPVFSGVHSKYFSHICWNSDRRNGCWQHTLWTQKILIINRKPYDVCCKRREEES